MTGKGKARKEIPDQVRDEADQARDEEDQVRDEEGQVRDEEAVEHKIARCETGLLNLSRRVNYRVLSWASAWAAYLVPASFW